MFEKQVKIPDPEVLVNSRIAQIPFKISSLFVGSGCENIPLYPTPFVRG